MFLGLASPAERTGPSSTQSRTFMTPVVLRLIHVASDHVDQPQHQANQVQLDADDELLMNVRELNNSVAKSDELIGSHISLGIVGLPADDLKVSHRLRFEVINRRK